MALSKGVRNTLSISAVILGGALFVAGVIMASVATGGLVAVGLGMATISTLPFLGGLIGSCCNTEKENSSQEKIPLHDSVPVYVSKKHDSAPEKSHGSYHFNILNELRKLRKEEKNLHYAQKEFQTMMRENMRKGPK